PCGQQQPRAGRDRSVQHRRQPPPHLWRPGRHRAAARPRRWTGRICRRPRAHQRSHWRDGVDQAHTIAWCGDRSPQRRQRGGDRCALRGPADLAVSSPPSSGAMSAIPYPAHAATSARDLAVTRASHPAWARPSFIALLLVTLFLYLVGLDRNGWANAYYAAAVQAGTQSWKAFFFGSLDASNFITVDKSPAFLWVMEVSARLFGFNQWSILAPQALEGVAAVAIVYV